MVFFADNVQVKKRVLIALGLLVGAKLLNITVPFFFKHAVDLLNSASGGKLNLVNNTYNNFDRDVAPKLFVLSKVGTRPHPLKISYLSKVCGTNHLTVRSKNNF